MNPQTFAVREATRNTAAAAEGFAYEQSRQERKAMQRFAWASIDWQTVEPLDEDDKCVWESRDYLSIPF